MSETPANPLDDLAADPFEIAGEAADDIARLTGVPRHDIALTLGSGWGGAAELIGETVATIPAIEVTGFSKPALEGHVGTLRSVVTPSEESSSTDFFSIAVSSRIGTPGTVSAISCPRNRLATTSRFSARARSW